MSKTTAEKQEVNVDFLRSKLSSGYNRWNDSEIEYKSQGTNIHRLSESVFNFTEYNFLPVNEHDILDGHFAIFVNKDTFQYLVYKSSDYGSLTYVREVEFAGFHTAETLPKISKVHIEGIIAHKLLTSYFYDSDHINHKGALLFPRTEDDNDIYSHRSLICDDRGYVWSDCKPETYSEPELQALKLLINWTPDTIEDFTKEFLSKLNKKFKKDKGTIQFEPLNINGKDYVLSHQVNEIYGNYSGLHIGKVGTKDNMISQKLLKHDLKDFIKIIPTILRNYAV